MRGKKGLDYIDWSISMGIFIVAITALFVFLKPGARPEHNQDTLINLVEQQFTKETQWFVHETPLFIEHFQALYGTGSPVEIKIEADMMRLTTIRPPPSNIFIVSPLPATTVRWNCNAINCDNTQFKLFGTTNTVQESTQMEITCTPLNDPIACAAVLGATITHQGMQQSKITLLGTQDYNAIKSTWTYPLQKEFAIYQDGHKIIGGQEPAQQVEVFVKEANMNLVAADGTQTTTTINIRVW
ncbi:hypothetical protein J4208_00735 [Candidatus Woesearchaeota archaeon]|nr:hypothetical protein [Candidatus Woesearchaeota archaeon]